MKKIILSTLAVALLAVAGLGQGTATTQPKPTPTPFTIALKVGDVAPDFTLKGTDGNTVKLSDLRGKSNAVLAFYVFAFTGG